MIEQNTENAFLGKAEEYKAYFGKFDNIIKECSDEDVDRDGTLAKNILKVQSDFIVEKDVLLRHIEEITETCGAMDALNEETKIESKEMKHYETQINHIITILGKYQEKASLLDPILELMVQPIMEYIRKFVENCHKKQKYIIPKHIESLFLLIYIIIKVRGEKIIFKMFPHEVNDLENVLEVLLHQNMGSNDTWFIPYILQVWLSIMLLLPFSMDSFGRTTTGQGITQTITKLCLDCLWTTGKLREGAALLLARLLTRPDTAHSLTGVIEHLRSEYVGYVQQSQNLHFLIGILMTFVQMLKIGERSELMKAVSFILPLGIKDGGVDDSNAIKNTVLRKYKTKLSQYLGLAYIKPVIASWRYQRGARSLNTLELGKGNQSVPETKGISGQKRIQSTTQDSSGTLTPSNLNTGNNVPNTEYDDIEIEEIEGILDFLLDSLKDKDTVVRWGAAKGIGRMTNRMPEDLADYIVGEVISVVDPKEGDGGWHGGCLAIAELCRRGLILPHRLGEVVKILEEALTYEIQKGSTCIGAHVRDAACYVAWTIARAYSPEETKPFVHHLAQTLIIVALFDRETNCRRAASAAFQEHVGRQGNFPNGIDILCEADYFTLANRVNSYLNASIFVAQYEHYYTALVNHLLNRKLGHCDEKLRKLAASAISVLVPINPQYNIDNILPKLCKNCVNPILNIRHGGLLGLAQLVNGLSGNSHINRVNIKAQIWSNISRAEQKVLADTQSRQSFQSKYDVLQYKNHIETLTEEELESIKEVITKLSAKKSLYRGKGGEAIRSGMCQLTSAISLAGIKLSSTLQITIFGLLMENICHPNVYIQEEAREALERFGSRYLEGIDIEDIDQEILGNIEVMLKGVVEDPAHDNTRGYSIGLASLSASLTLNYLQPIATKLCKNCLIKYINKREENKAEHGKRAHNDDPETRVAALKGLISVIFKIGRESREEYIGGILDAMFMALNDYTHDKRGDVGSWVRMEAMRSIYKLIENWARQSTQENAEVKQPSPHFTTELIFKYTSCCLKQISEKIDNLRFTAGEYLERLIALYDNPSYVLPSPSIPELETLKSIFLYNKEIFQERSDLLRLMDEEMFLPWYNPKFSFKRISPLINSQVYSYSIMEGWLVSSGGLTESTLRAASDILTDFISTDDMDSKIHLISVILQVMEKRSKVDRIIAPTIATLHTLYESNYLDDEELLPLNTKLFGILKKEISGSKNIIKVMKSIRLLVGILDNVKDLKYQILEGVIELLYHSYPKVRKTAAESLYLYIVTNEWEDISPDEASFQQLSKILSSTNWADNLESISSNKEDLKKLLILDPVTPMVE